MRDPSRSDVEVVTVEIDAATAALAAQHPWPPWVELRTGDAVEVTRGTGSFDLIFADAQGGKRPTLLVRSRIQLSRVLTVSLCADRPVATGGGRPWGAAKVRAKPAIS